MSTISLLLDFIDFFSALPGVVMIGLLRQGYTLPPSLLRPPRFDHTFIISSPDVTTRRSILQRFLGQAQIVESDLSLLAEVQLTLRTQKSSY